MAPDPDDRAAPKHNYEYGREHDGCSHVGIPPGCPACAAERQNAPTASDDRASAALAAIRAIERAATPGEWKPRTVEGRGGWALGSKTYAVHRVEADAEPNGIGIFSTEADAEFIVTARTAMPRLLVAVERVLELHRKQDKPVRSWDLDLRCAAHDWTKRVIRSFDAVRDCPDCRYTEYYACSHCRCPDDAWPCPTVRAITAELAGDSESEPPQTEAERRAADEAIKALRERLAGDG